MRPFANVLALSLVSLLLLAIPAHAASSELPIFPPASVFKLPPSAERTPVQPASLAFQPPAKSTDEAYGFFTHQNGDYSYFVTTFRSLTDAVQDDKVNRRLQPGYRPVLIHHPVAAGEWLNEDNAVPPSGGSSGVPTGAIGVGLVYRNLSLTIYVTVLYAAHDSPATKAHQMTEGAQIALDTLSRSPEIWHGLLSVIRA